MSLQLRSLRCATSSPPIADPVLSFHFAGQIVVEFTSLRHLLRVPRKRARDLLNTVPDHCRIEWQKPKSWYAPQVGSSSSWSRSESASWLRMLHGRKKWKSKKARFGMRRWTICKLPILALRTLSVQFCTKCVSPCLRIQDTCVSLED